VFYKIVLDTQAESIDKLNISWSFLQSNLKWSTIKPGLEFLDKKDLSKSLIDALMPFNLNYIELKSSLNKIEKSLILILDLVKSTVDFNIKKSMVRTLYTSNINKNFKLNNLRDQIIIKKDLLKKVSEMLPVMQSDLTLILTNPREVFLF